MKMFNKGSSLPKKQSGFTLVEVAIVVAVVLLLLSGIVGAQRIVAGTKVNDEIGELKLVASNIQKIYSSSPNYTGATLAQIIALKGFPDNRVSSPTTATNRWGGSIAAIPATTNSTDDTIQYTTPNVPEYECVNIIPQAENAFVRVTVDGTDVKPANGTLDRNALATSCAGTSNSIVYFIAK